MGAQTGSLAPRNEKTESLALTGAMAGTVPPRMPPKAGDTVEASGVMSGSVKPRPAEGKKESTVRLN